MMNVAPAPMINRNTKATTPAPTISTVAVGAK
jgi:hypothetical protein